MPRSPVAVEPSDCWRLCGVDDASTPPTISRLLHTVGTRAEWRRAGLAVVFDELGQVRPVVRGGREYRFERVDEGVAASLPRCRPVLS